MLTMYIICIACFAATILGFIYLSYKGLISKKESLSGILASIVVQVATSTITGVIANVTTNYAVIVVVELLVLVGLSVASLYLVFRFIIKERPMLYSYSSYGFGFGLSLSIMQVLPVSMNSLTYYNAIKDGSIYDLLADVYSTTEIDSIIESFNSIPFVYYLAVALEAIALFVVFAYSFNAIRSSNKAHIIEGYVVLVLFCAIMLIIPCLNSYNLYWIAVVGYALISAYCIFGMYKDQVIEFSLKK